MKRVLLLLALCYYGAGISAQTTPPSSSGSSLGSAVAPESLAQPMSKGAGGLGYSVDMYSGTSNVSVPVYNYTLDGLDLGVSLNYNTGGIHVDDVASSEGLGWSLFAGGYITRQVNGIEDEVTIPSMGPETLYLGFQYPKVYELLGTWVDYSGQSDTMSVEGDYTNNVGENDVFTANLGGRVVNFVVNFQENDFYGRGYYIVVKDPKCHINVAITLNDTNLYNIYRSTGFTVPLGEVGTNRSSGIISFIITDEKGNQWFFSRGDYMAKKNYKPDNSAYSLYWATTKWVLSKVVTSGGHQVTFNYQTYNMVNYPMSSIDKVTERTPDIGTFSSYAFIDSFQVPIMDSGTVVHLSSIKYPNGDSITFNMHPNSRCDIQNTYALDSITIRNAYDSKVSNTLTYRFNYSYFKANSTTDQAVSGCSVDQLNLRLKLNSIYKVGTDHSTKELYDSFVYNTVTPLPPRLDPQRDYYGYYNGNSPVKYTFTIGATDYSWQDSARFNHLCIPLHTFTFNKSGTTWTYTYGVDKTPNIAYTVADILKTVVNGTGGQTQFYYLSHSLSNPPDCQPYPNGANTHYYFDDTSNAVAAYSISPDLDGSSANDGACLAKIVTYDGFNTDNNTTATYTYANGMRFFPGGYCWYPIFTRSSAPSDPPSPTAYDNTWYQRNYENAFVTPMDNINGFNHGYSDVTVKTTGYNNEIISNKHYHFTNLISQAGEFQHDIVGRSRLSNRWGLFKHTMPRYYFRKNLMGLLTEEDDSDKNGYLMSQIINQYTRDSDSVGYSPISPGSSHILANPWRQFSAAVNTTFGPSNYLVEEQYLPILSETSMLYTTTAKQYSGTSGQYMQDVKTYTYDTDDDIKQVSGTDSRGSAWIDNYAYFRGNYISTNKYDILWKFLVQNDKIINGSYATHTRLDYSLHGSGIPSSITFPASYVLKNNSLTPYPPALPEIKAKDYTVMDVYNNVLETWYNDDKKVGSAIWDTHIGQKVADISNAKNNQVAYTSFEGYTYAPLGTADNNKGNWDFDPTLIKFADSTSLKALTGRYYIQLPLGPTRVTSLNAPANGANYIITLWADAYSSSGILYGPFAKLGTTTNITLTPQYQTGGWTLFTGTFTGDGTNKVVIAGDPTRTQGSRIDELRIYPVNAAMTTTTYEPLLGPSSKCDERNNILYYEYDVMGRLKDTRDINHNITSLVQTIQQGANH